MARRTKEIYCAALLVSLLFPFRATADDALTGLTPIVQVPVTFKNAQLAPPDSVLDALAAASKRASLPRCYWAASGATPAQAKAVRAALGDVAVAPERVILRAAAAPASASAYCDAPKTINLSFEKGLSTLSDAGRETLDFAALFIGDRPADKIYAVIGQSVSGERDNPQQLALERAITARGYLVAKGIAAPRLTIKSAQGDVGAVTINFE